MCVDNVSQQEEYWREESGRCNLRTFFCPTMYSLCFATISLPPLLVPLWTCVCVCVCVCVLMLDSPRCILSLDAEQERREEGDIVAATIFPILFRVLFCPYFCVSDPLCVCVCVYCLVVFFLTVLFRYCSLFFVIPTDEIQLEACEAQ
jgi:hypothetical protein